MEVADRAVGGGKFALKVVKRQQPADDAVLDRMRAECEASAKLNFPSVLKSFDFRLHRTWFRIDRGEQLMEYVAGQPLSALSELPLGAATLIFLRSASALAHMHRRGVLHGDFRPAKVLISRGGQVKVGGYGLSLMRPGFKTLIKPDGNFAAPERSKRQVLDELTDVFAVGATFYHVLTGRPAVALHGSEGDPRIPQPMAINKRIPPALNELIVTCIKTNPEQRPPDMYEVVKQLETLVKSWGLKDDELAGLARAKEPSEE
jgi:serine/threonine-protein kinase